MVGAILSNVLKLMAIVFIIFALFWLGTCAYGNTIGRPQVLEPPNMQDAQYIINVKYPPAVYYAESYTSSGDIGSRVYDVIGIWELRDDNYIRLGNIIIDESIFGPVDIRRRS